MRKEMFIFVFLIALICFSYAQQINYSEEELMILAQEQGINLSEEEINQLKNLIEQNEIDINELDLQEMQKEMSQEEEIGFEEAKEIAEQIGINESQMNGMIEEYIELNGCDLIEQHKNQIIGQQIPEKIPYKNEIINLYLSEEILGQVVILESEINSIECQAKEEETYQIHIQNSTVLLDLAQDFNIEDLNQKIKDEEIVVKGIGLGKKIKWFFSKLAFNWFI